MVPFDRSHNDFLLAFHSYYHRISCRFQGKARYWSKIVIFFIPLLYKYPREKLLQVFLLRQIPALSDGNIDSANSYLFTLTSSAFDRQTDRQTDRRKSNVNSGTYFVTFTNKVKYYHHLFVENKNELIFMRLTLL